MSDLKEQAGIYKINLLEDKDVSLVYDSAGGVTYIYTNGETIELENDQEIALTENLVRSNNNRLHYQLTFSWDIFNLTEENNELIQRIVRSAYGWLITIEYYNKDNKAILRPQRFVNGAINNQLSAHSDITLQNPVSSKADKKVDYDLAVWILEENIWNDSGIWFDTATWND